MECPNRNVSPGTQQMAPFPSRKVAVRRFPFEN